MENNLAIALFFASVVFLIRFLYKRASQRHSLPPGPPGWPLVGNIMDIPTDYNWRGYAELGNKYGKKLADLSLNMTSHIVLLLLR